MFYLAPLKACGMCSMCSSTLPDQEGEKRKKKEKSMPKFEFQCVFSQKDTYLQRRNTQENSRKHGKPQARSAICFHQTPLPLYYLWTIIHVTLPHITHFFFFSILKVNWRLLWRFVLGNEVPTQTHMYWLLKASVLLLLEFPVTVFVFLATN